VTPSAPEETTEASTGTAGGTGQTSQPNGSNGSKNAAGTGGQKPAQTQKPTPVATETAKPKASHSDNGGGSSPLVPILIAIAVLAAISIGAVLWRQRRNPGAPVSPNAN
jgi:cobalamin biosynthesis Mg chelatase CobN